MALFENLADTPPAKIVDPGEYTVRVERVELKASSKNPACRFANFLLIIEDDPEAEPIFHALFLPGTDADARTNLNRMRQAKTFYDAFGLDYEADAESFIGLTAKAILKQEEYNGQMQNSVKSFVTAG